MFSQRHKHPPIGKQASISRQHEFASNRRPRRICFAAAVSVLIVLAAGVAWWIAHSGTAATRSELVKLARRNTPGIGGRLAEFVAQHPDDAEVVELLAAWHLRENSPFEISDRVLSRLCELRPDAADPVRTRAALRARNGQSEEAVVDGLRALALAPSDDETRRLVAVAAAAAGDYEVAIRELRTLYDAAAPPRFDIGAKLIKANLLANKVDEAERVLDECFPADVSGEDGQALRAQVWQAAGRHEEAAKSLRLLANRSRVYREFALFRLAQSFTALGRESDARKVLDELERCKARTRAVVDASQRPDDLAAQLRSAEILLEEGRDAEARTVLQLAIRRFGRTPDLERWLARADRGEESSASGGDLGRDALP